MRWELPRVDGVVTLISAARTAAVNARAPHPILLGLSIDNSTTSTYTSTLNSYTTFIHRLLTQLLRLIVTTSPFSRHSLPHPLLTLIYQVFATN
jgi:hypothetical protein